MAPSATRRVLMLVKAVVSFRVLLALSTSASVTAVVAGPMAYQANKARNEVVAAAPTTVPPPTTEAPVITEPAESTTTSSSTTTSTTTTTTTEAPAPGVTTTTAPAEDPVTPTGLLASSLPDHSNPKLLDGARLTAVVWVYFDGSGVTEVRYWIDDPTGTGEPDRVAQQPFDLEPDGFDARRLGLGTHTLLAEVTTIDGSTYRRLATFTAVG